MDKFFGLDSVSKCDENMDLLVTVHDPICLAIYTDILRDAGIPYLVKERGAGRLHDVRLGRVRSEG